MEHIGSLVKNLWSFPSWKERLDAAKVLSKWEILLGSAIARVASPFSFREGVLWVEVEDSLWLNRLHFEERKILDILNQEAGQKLFKSIRWSLRRRRKFTSSFKKRRNAEVLVSKQVRDKFFRELSCIEDEELRKAFLSLRITLFKKKQRSSVKKKYKAL